MKPDHGPRFRLTRFVADRVLPSQEITWRARFLNIAPLSRGQSVRSQENCRRGQIGMSVTIQLRLPVQNSWPGEQRIGPLRRKGRVLSVRRIGQLRFW